MLMPNLPVPSATPPRPRRWSRDELTVVCGLYFTLPFGRMHSRNPEIIEIARLLHRTPSSIAMKLVNFASLDPDHRKRGVKGLSGRSREDAEVWREFNENWDEVAERSERMLLVLRFPPSELAASPEPVGVIATEVMRTIAARTKQAFFRKVVLAAYNSVCCVTGNPVLELLVASHILPWGRFPAERLNPRNGLCLSAHFDRAFDRGLMTFDEDLRLVVGQALRSYSDHPSIQTEFLAREGTRLTVPERFAPDLRFLEYHRNNLFESSQPFMSDGEEAVQTNA